LFNKIKYILLPSLIIHHMIVLHTVLCIGKVSSIFKESIIIGRFWRVEWQNYSDSLSKTFYIIEMLKVYLLSFTITFQK